MTRTRYTIHPTSVRVRRIPTITRRTAVRRQVGNEVVTVQGCWRDVEAACRDLPDGEYQVREHLGEPERGWDGSTITYLSHSIRVEDGNVDYQ